MVHMNHYDLGLALVYTVIGFTQASREESTK